jgi:hypothetical protein
MVMSERDARGPEERFADRLRAVFCGFGGSGFQSNQGLAARWFSGGFQTVKTVAGRRRK